MAFETIDIPRYILYALDFIFGVLSWGITADKLKFTRGGVSLCGLNKATIDSGIVFLEEKEASCNAVIALGVLTMIALLVVIVLRTLDVFEVISLPELVETIMFGVMTLIWFILAIVTVAVTNSVSRQADEVRAAIAGAWLAFLTHTGSIVVSLLAHRQKG